MWSQERKFLPRRCARCSKKQTSKPSSSPWSAFDKCFQEFLAGHCSFIENEAVKKKKEEQEKRKNRRKKEKICEEEEEKMQWNLSRVRLSFSEFLFLFPFFSLQIWPVLYRVAQTLVTWDSNRRSGDRCSEVDASYRIHGSSRCSSYQSFHRRCCQENAWWYIAQAIASAPCAINLESHLFDFVCFGRAQSSRIHPLKECKYDQRWSSNPKQLAGAHDRCQKGFIYIRGAVELLWN